VVLVPKSSTDGKKDDSDQNSNYGTKVHSSVLMFFSPVLKGKLKGMLKSGGLYHVNMDIDVSTQGIQAFVNCLYKKPTKAPFDQAILSDALKLATFYQVPIFIFEELFANKSIYLCLAECLKRDKEEVKILLESCKGEFHDQGDAKWIVVRGPLRGHNDTPFRRPTALRAYLVFLVTIN
jgi:hypothetical protein